MGLAEAEEKAIEQYIFLYLVLQPLHTNLCLRETNVDEIHPVFIERTRFSARGNRKSSAWCTRLPVLMPYGILTVNIN